MTIPSLASGVSQRTEASVSENASWQPRITTLGRWGLKEVEVLLSNIAWAMNWNPCERGLGQLVGQWVIISLRNYICFWHQIALGWEIEKTWVKCFLYFSMWPSSGFFFFLICPCFCFIVVIQSFPRTILVVVVYCFCWGDKCQNLLALHFSDVPPLFLCLQVQV